MPPRPRVLTLLYHEVVDDPAESGFQTPGALPYKHRSDDFRQNLEVIARSGHPVCTVEKIDANARGRHIMLTFDDGGKSAMRIAGYLEEKGWRGHFFITTNMIGAPLFVTADDIRELRRRGHVIGSHSHTHPAVFRCLSEAEMLGEWQTSCQTLSAILREPITTASIPGGDMNRMTATTAARAGIQSLFTSEMVLRPWRQGGLTCFGRVYPKRDTSLQVIDQYVHFRGLLKPLLIRRCKQTVKRLLGPLYYRRQHRPH